MWRVVKKILILSEDKARTIKTSVLSAFLYSLFISLPYLAVYFFSGQLSQGQLNTQTIWICIGILAISLVGGSVSKIITYRLQSWAGNHVAARERLFIGDRLKRVPMGFFREKTLGDITAALTSDITYYEKSATSILDSIINGSISAFISSLFLMLFDWRLGLIFLTGFICAVLIMNKIQNEGAKIVPLKKKAETDVISATLEFIRGISVFKLFHMGGKSTEKIKQSYKTYGEVSSDFELKLSPWSILLHCCLKIAIAAIILLAPYLALNGDIDIATAFVMIIASFQIFRSVEALATASGLVRTMDATINRMEEIRSFPMIDENSSDVALNSFDIEFEHVNFAYQKETDIIKDASFSIPQNTMTALVGSSGSGKTTIARLIARFWDVSDGSIRIGGIDIKDITCDSLLGNMSIVFQNVYLFNDTIAANIRYGNPNATQEEVEEAAKKACCHEFIMALPNGYDTAVGESGSHLSGGEKQRISIARAILKNAPIVLLDEATSNIDPDNEVYIQKAINELVKDKTLIVIAHRLSTIKDADQIIVMDNGTISQIGTHQKLIEADGQYKKFWEISQKAGHWRLV